MEMDTLGKKICRHRKAKGYSQEELAELVGVSRQAISKWEADLTRPSFDNLQALCVALKVKMDFFMDEWSRVPESENKGEAHAKNAMAAAAGAESVTVAEVAAVAESGEEEAAVGTAASRDDEEAEKEKRKRKRKFILLLLGIVVFALLFVVGCVITVVLGFVVFTPNQGDDSLNSMALMKDEFFWVLLATLTVLLVEIILIRVFRQRKG
ncbi:MAG TPA: helix-turn-helix transcriptional regulator [Candidatus Scatosoma pullicola]|nr:helix-turn-helix transcriptional regulator [Candidatus Scatosoma pullicola]